MGVTGTNSIAVAAKLAPPRISRAFLRADQIEKLAAVSGFPVTVIAAPAGYGKTTLVAEASRRLGWTPIWYRCDALDHLPNMAVATLTEGLRLRWPAFGESLAADLAGEEPSRFAVEEVVARFASELSRCLDGELHIVFDDFEQVPTHAHVARLFELLVANLPAQVHLVVLTRKGPVVSLARLRLSGQLHEIDHRDLRFDLDQASSVVELRTSVRLTRGEVGQLLELTEGWPVGVELAARALSWRDFGSLAEALARPAVKGALFDYLAEEVFDRQSADTRSFLKRTCCLDYITPELAQQLAAVDDARPTLEQLARNGTFTWAADDCGTYRYHNLFREHLQSRIIQDDGAAALRDLRLETAEALECRGDIDSSVELLLQAGEPGKVLEVFVRGGYHALAQCGTDLMKLAADRMVGTAASEPVALITNAMVAHRLGRLREALACTRAALAQLPEGASDDLRDLALEAAQELSFYCGDHHAVIELSRQALDGKPGRRHRGQLLFHQAFSLAGLGRWDEVSATLQAARDDNSVDAAEMAMLEGLQMTLHEMRGDYRAALTAGRQALPKVIEAAPASARAGFLSALASIELASGNYYESEVQLGRCKEICDRFDLQFRWLLSEGAGAMLLIARGRIKQGLELLERCLASPLICDDLETQAQFSVGAGRAWRRLGRLSQAERCFSEALEPLRRLDSPECRLSALANLAFVQGMRNSNGHEPAARLMKMSSDAGGPGLRIRCLRGRVPRSNAGVSKRLVGRSRAIW